MASDPSASSGGRPRPWLLALLGVVVVAFVAFRMWPAGEAVPAIPASNHPQAASRGQKAVQPSDLEVRLGTLTAPRPAPDDAVRNPFRFQPKPAPPPVAVAPPPPPMPAGPPPVTGPPPPPPIPLKFIGIVEKAGLKVAAMSDCRSTYYGTEGEVIDGRYRLVRIGVESMVIEYVDGRGRTTVRLEGCSPR